MSTFAVTDDSQVLPALNYVLSNLGTSTGNVDGNVLTANTTTGVVSQAGSSNVFAYLYQYVNLRYSNNAIGTDGFSSSSDNFNYFGVYNSSSNVASTNPTAYQWFQVSPRFDSATNRTLYYSAVGGRQIQWAAANALPNTGFVESVANVAIDLDVVTTAEGTPGERGAIAMAYVITPATPIGATTANLTAWFSADRTNLVAPIGTGLTPVTGDTAQFVYVDGVGKPTETYTFNGTTWSAAEGQVISGNVIVSETLPGNAIVSNTITATQIASNTITATQIATNTITANNIASNTITANNIASNTITATQIATNTITSNNIATGTITANNIAGNTITATQIATNTITSNNIATGTITANNIAGNTITANNIATGTLTTNLFTANTIQGNIIAAGTITATQLAANAITANTVVSTGATLGSNTSPGFWLDGTTGNARFGNSVSIGNLLTIGANATIGGNLAVTGLISSGALVSNTVNTVQIVDNAVTETPYALNNSGNAYVWNPGSVSSEQTFYVPGVTSLASATGVTVVLTESTDIFASGYFTFIFQPGDTSPFTDDYYIVINLRWVETTSGAVVAVNSRSLITNTADSNVVNLDGNNYVAFPLAGATVGAGTWKLVMQVIISQQSGTQWTTSLFDMSQIGLLFLEFKK